MEVICWFMPSKSIMNQRTNGSTYGPTDRPTYPCIEEWLGTKIILIVCLSLYGMNHFQSRILSTFICRGQLQYFVND